MSPSIPSRVFPFLAVVCALALSSTSQAGARITGAIILTSGSGTSTITSLIENPDGTLSIEADQAGYLSGIGNVVGQFSYTAHIDYNTGTTLLNGSGYLVTAKGDRIDLSIQIVEVGIDYPRPYVGVLTVRGGTGRFAGASGYLNTAGLDEESLTDKFTMSGVISTLRL